jgi:hypothetical protein
MTAVMKPVSRGPTLETVNRAGIAARAHAAVLAAPLQPGDSIDCDDIPPGTGITGPPEGGTL